MVVGDREAESSSRLNRPATIEHEDHVEAAPIKFWSAMHVQLYLALNKVPLNPMYDYGFFSWVLYMPGSEELGDIADNRGRQAEMH
jgi:3'-phosphoadenosine 5'-phosphosulfate sulfotransferase (PAPS reductase)/FAD synthetase